MGLSDTIKACFEYTTKKLIGESPWKFVGSEHIWRLIDVVQDPLGIGCTCTWEAIGLRFILQKIRTFLVTTTLYCPKDQNDCETEYEAESLKTSIENETETTFYDIPLPPPYEKKLNGGILGDGGRCICFPPQY